LKIQRFEDIKAWQAGRQLVRMVYSASRQGAFARDLRLASQMRSAAVSVMSNIAEGFDAGSDAEFIRFLRYARRSATEMQSQLYAALDVGYLDDEAFRRLYDKATDVKKLVNAFIRYLRSSSRESQEGDAPELISAGTDPAAS
jgi:four helix bundle protein